MGWDYALVYVSHLLSIPRYSSSCILQAYLLDYPCCRSPQLHSLAIANQTRRLQDQRTHNHRRSLDNPLGLMAHSKQGELCSRRTYWRWLTTSASFLVLARSGAIPLNESLAQQSLLSLSKSSSSSSYRHISLQPSIVCSPNPSSMQRSSRIPSSGGRGVQLKYGA